jgi:queuine/archaeosine tRNA-ribosyltransferase
MEKKTLKEEGIEYVAHNVFCDGITDFELEISLKAFIAGGEWQAERMYSYDELRQIAYNAYCIGQLEEPTENKYNLWIQQFKKK